MITIFPFLDVCAELTLIKRFLGDLPGCNYQKGFFINGKGSELIVTESVIDAMSIMSILKEKGLDYKNYSFLSLSGVDKNNALKFHLDHNKKISVSSSGFR